jgi:outer membrane lipoprotein-sorting protein
MRKNNNKKINLWTVIIIITSIWIAVCGWLLNSQARIDDRLENYQAQVQDYKNELNQINTRLGTIEEAINWIKQSFK